jgi:hypothetical protein
MRRIVTFWLIAQIVLPFTAPFPVCDLADLLSGAPHHSAPLSSNVPDSRTDASYSYAPPLVTTDGRLRLHVVADMPEGYVDEDESPDFIILPLVLYGVPPQVQLQSAVLRV